MLKLLRNTALVIGVAAILGIGSAFPLRMFAQEQSTVPDKSRSRRVGDAEPLPTPTPPRHDIRQDSDEVVRVETNLTSIFFTAADSNKRFISNMKKEDIQIFEDGQPQ